MKKTKQLELNIQLTNKQKQALEFLSDNKTTEILYGGAAGSGKSFLGCLWILTSAIKYKGTRWLIGRKNISTLKQTTLTTFFEVCSIFKLKSENGYKYNQQSNTITLFNGSEILLKDLDYYPGDPNYDSLGSLEITGAFIDEIPQITERAKNMVNSRIRFKLDEFQLVPKLFMSCNPSKGWLYEKYYKKSQENKLEDYIKFIPALPTDNPFLTKHYIIQLQKSDDQTKQRLLYGNWDYAMENTLFKFDALISLFDNVHDTGLEKYMTIDVARKNDKTVAFIWDGLNVLDVYFCNHTNFNEQLTKLKELKDKYSIKNKNIIVDSDGIGSPVTDLMQAIEFHNNGKPFDNENYNNVKSQLYFKLAEYVNEGKFFINNKLFNSEQQFSIITEIENHRQDDIDKDGKVKITPKEKIKQIIGRSPDFADALMMRMWWEFKRASGFSKTYAFANY